MVLEEGKKEEEVEEEEEEENEEEEEEGETNWEIPSYCFSLFPGSTSFCVDVSKSTEAA